MKYVNFTQQFIDVHYEVFTIKLVKMFTGVITDDILNAIDLADNHHTPINLEMWASRATRTHLTPPPIFFSLEICLRSNKSDPLHVTITSEVVGLRAIRS